MDNFDNNKKNILLECIWKSYWFFYSPGLPHRSFLPSIEILISIRLSKATIQLFFISCTITKVSMNLRRLWRRCLIKPQAFCSLAQGDINVSSSTNCMNSLRLTMWLIQWSCISAMKAKNISTLMMKSLRKVLKFLLWMPRPRIFLFITRTQKFLKIILGLSTCTTPKCLNNNS